MISRQNYLEDLPSEMIIKILEYLDLKSLYHFVKTYHELMIDDSKFRMYWIKLFDQFFPYLCPLFLDRFFNNFFIDWPKEFKKAYAERRFFEVKLFNNKKQFDLRKDYRLHMENTTNNGMFPQHHPKTDFKKMKHTTDITGYTKSQALLDHLYAMACGYFIYSLESQWGSYFINFAINDKNRYNSWTLVHWAAFCNQIDFMHLYAMEWDCDFDYVDGCYDVPTPLFIAVRSGRRDMVNTLLAYGANIHVVDSSGRTVLHYAAESGFTEIVKILLQHGSSAKLVNSLDNKELTPLHLATINGHVNVLAILLKTPGIDKNPGSRYFVSNFFDGIKPPFYHAIKHRHIPCIEKLLSTPGIYTACANDLLSDFPMSLAKKITKPKIKNMFIKMIIQQKLIEFSQLSPGEHLRRAEIKDPTISWPLFDEDPRPGLVSHFSQKVTAAEELKRVVYGIADASCLKDHMHHFKDGELSDIYNAFYALGEFNLPDIQSRDDITLKCNITP